MHTERHDTLVIIAHRYATHKFAHTHSLIELTWLGCAGRLSWKGVFYKHNVCRLVGVNDPQPVCVCAHMWVFG